MLKDIKGFLKVLIEEKAINTVYPVLHLWLLYICLFLVMIAVFNTVVATLVSALGVLFWSRQTKTVKDSFNTLWYSDLPALKFHFVGICIEMGVVLIVAKPSMFISSLVKKYGKQ